MHHQFPKSGLKAELVERLVRHLVDGGHNIVTLPQLRFIMMLERNTSLKAPLADVIFSKAGAIAWIDEAKAHKTKEDAKIRKNVGDMFNETKPKSRFKTGGCSASSEADYGD